MKDSRLRFGAGIPEDQVIADITYFGERVIYADPTRRTKETHPYSYDPIPLLATGRRANGSVYTDRLLQWDMSKYNKLRRKHMGNEAQIWSPGQWGCTYETIMAFLRDWIEDPALVLTGVTEYCNVATGYPTWLLEYFSPKFEAERAARRHGEPGAHHAG